MEKGEGAYEKGTGEGVFNFGGVHDSRCALKAAVNHEEASVLTEIGIKECVGMLCSIIASTISRYVCDDSNLTL